MPVFYFFPEVYEYMLWSLFLIYIPKKNVPNNSMLSFFFLKTLILEKFIPNIERNIMRLRKRYIHMMGKSS